MSKIKCKSLLLQSKQNQINIMLSDIVNFYLPATNGVECVMLKTFIFCRVHHLRELMRIVIGILGNVMKFFSNIMYITPLCLPFQKKVLVMMIQLVRIHRSKCFFFHKKVLSCRGLQTFLETFNPRGIVFQPVTFLLIEILST